MTTINGQTVEIRYALVDLTAPTPQLNAMRSDLRLLHRRRRQGALDVDIGINTNRAGTQAVIKIAVAPEDFPALANHFSNASWRQAVIAVRDESALDQVRAIVTAPDWLPLETEV